MPSPDTSSPPCRDLQVTLEAKHSSVAVTRTSACEVSFEENATFNNRNSQRWGSGWLFVFAIYRSQFITELFLHATVPRAQNSFPSNYAYKRLFL